VLGNFAHDPRCRRQAMRVMVWSIALALIAGGSSPDADVAAALDLTGHWVDDQCTARPSADPQKVRFLKRDFRFDATAGTWQVDARIYTDAACTIGLFTLHVEGNYEITGAAKLAGTFEGSFHYVQRTVTLHSRGFAQVLEQAYCAAGPIQPELPVDVGASWCAPIGTKPIAVAGGEYDLVKVDDDRVYFGKRTDRMNAPDGRPTELNPVGSRRVKDQQ
jgi:Adenomatosis polyposis coli down-regulated 1